MFKNFLLFQALAIFFIFSCFIGQSKSSIFQFDVCPFIYPMSNLNKTKVFRIFLIFHKIIIN